MRSCNKVFYAFIHPLCPSLRCFCSSNLVDYIRNDECIDYHAFAFSWQISFLPGRQSLFHLFKVSWRAKKSFIPSSAMRSRSPRCSLDVRMQKKEQGERANNEARETRRKRSDFLMASIIRWSMQKRKTNKKNNAQARPTWLASSRLPSPLLSWELLICLKRKEKKEERG